MKISASFIVMFISAMAAVASVVESSQFQPFGNENSISNAVFVNNTSSLTMTTLQCDAPAVPAAAFEVDYPVQQAYDEHDNLLSTGKRSSAVKRCLVFCFLVASVAWIIVEIGFAILFFLAPRQYFAIKAMFRKRPKKEISESQKEIDTGKQWLPAKNRFSPLALVEIHKSAGDHQKNAHRRKALAKNPALSKVEKEKTFAENRARAKLRFNVEANHTTFIDYHGTEESADKRAAYRRISGDRATQHRRGLSIAYECIFNNQDLLAAFGRSIAQVLEDAKQVAAFVAGFVPAAPTAQPLEEVTLLRPRAYNSTVSSAVGERPPRPDMAEYRKAAAAAAADDATDVTVATEAEANNENEAIVQVEEAEAEPILAGAEANKAVSQIETDDTEEEVKQTNLAEADDATAVPVATEAEASDVESVVQVDTQAAIAEANDTTADPVVTEADVNAEESNTEAITTTANPVVVEAAPEEPNTTDTTAVPVDRVEAAPEEPISEAKIEEQPAAIATEVPTDVAAATAEPVAAVTEDRPVPMDIDSVQITQQPVSRASKEERVMPIIRRNYVGCVPKSVTFSLAGNKRKCPFREQSDQQKKRTKIQRKRVHVRRNKSKTAKKSCAVQSKMTPKESRIVVKATKAPSHVVKIKLVLPLFVASIVGTNQRLRYRVIKGYLHSREVLKMIVMARLYKAAVKYNTPLLLEASIVETPATMEITEIPAADDTMTASEDFDEESGIDMATTTVTDAEVGEIPVVNDTTTDPEDGEEPGSDVATNTTTTVSPPVVRRRSEGLLTKAAPNLQGEHLDAEAEEMTATMTADSTSPPPRRSERLKALAAKNATNTEEQPRKKPAKRKAATTSVNPRRSSRLAGKPKVNYKATIRA